MRLLGSVVALCCATSVAHAQHGFWRPDERVLITSFLNARGLATDQRHVWVATEFGLEIYDPAFKRWLPPSTIEDGYPVLERPARIAYDNQRRELWLLTEAQQLYTYSPPMQSWQRRFASDLSPELRERLARHTDNRDPAWAIARNFIGRDGSARQWPVTAVEPAERSGTFWAATLGANFALVDTRNLSSEPYVFGTISRGVSALTVDLQGDLYFGGDGVGPRSGIARSDSALQRWRHYESRVAEGPRHRVHAMAATAQNVYAGGSDGLFVLRNERWQRLLDVEVHTLAFARGRVWVGSRGKLGWIDEAGAFTTMDEFPMQDVYGLATRNDTVWVAASGGLYELVGAELRQIVNSTAFGVAATTDGVIAVTNRGIIAREAEAWVELPPHASYAAIGRFISIGADGPRVWFGGTHGLAEWNTTTNTWRHLSVPMDIPEGPIYDVVHHNERLWLATPAGALGLQWR